MIKSMLIRKIEMRAYMRPDEMKKHHNININYDFVLKEPVITEDNIRFEYNFGIVYTNPSFGYLRYEGEVDCTKTVETIKDITAELKSEVSSMVMLNVLPMALLSSRQMGLPPAVPLPLPGIPASNTPDDKKGYE